MPCCSINDMTMNVYKRISRQFLLLKFSSVSMLTTLRGGRPGFDSLQGLECSNGLQTGSGVHPVRTRGSFLDVKTAVKLTTQLHLVPRS